MQQIKEANRYIIFTGVLTGCISSVYFLSLLFSVPLPATAGAVLVSSALLAIWMFRGNKSAPPRYSSGLEWLGIGLLAAAIFLLCQEGIAVAKKYGEWDAMAIWNLHARYLADPENWQKLFQNVHYGHPDYPICLPATLAFFMRLFSSPGSYMIPFIFSMYIAICIPVLIYGELWRRNGPVAVVILALFVIEIFYIINSMSQNADLLLSFFFLSAMVCSRYAAENNKYLVLSILFVGCCAWTKNEGIILAAIFLAFNARLFFSKKALRYTIVAMLAPALIIITYKLRCPVKNDIMSELNGNVAGHLFSKERYETVSGFFMEIINKRLAYTRLLVAVFLILCLAKRKWPGKDFGIVATCIAAYFMIYILTPKDINWHLDTSAERLIFQLYPSLLFAVGSGLSTTETGLSKIWQRDKTQSKAPSDDSRAPRSNMPETRKKAR